MKFGLGQSPRRVEDERLVTGRGRFTDDVQLPGMAYGVTLRTPYGHAEIRGIDTACARAMPGVLAIYTHADLAGYGPIPAAAPGPVNKPRPLLASDRVRFVGDGLAFVVAETRQAARAAAEAIVVDYADLPATGSIAAALEAEAPLVWEDAPGNLAFDWHRGDPQATAAAIAQAAHVTRLRIVQNRVAPSSMEVRAAVGAYDPEAGYTLVFGSQGVAGARSALADAILRVPPEKLRVVTHDVGGGFGMKGGLYPEYAIVLHAAKALGRPVKWTGERSDAFLSDTHGRDMESEVELALDRDGRILALRVETWANLGAYMSQYGAMVQTNSGGRIVGGVYRIPAIYNRVHGVFTNTAPVDAYRGAGRPEAAYLMERALEAAAREVGLGVDEIRRRNLLTPAELPHANGLGLTFDVGDFPTLLERALALADWAGFEARRQGAASRGRRYGRGLGFYVEIAGGGSEEHAAVRVGTDGVIELSVGTQSNGQGHETAYAQVMAEKLGIDIEQVRVRQGDTAVLDSGGGTGGSRSLIWGGGATLAAADDLVERGKALAAEALGTSTIDYAAGLFRAPATNRTLSLAELASRFPGRLDGRSRYAPSEPRPTFPNGCHAAEVEIDPGTGAIRVRRYSVVDDFGVLLNPMLVLGQIHGGVVQGLGQALHENLVYDGAAQLLTGSFLDYGIPRAEDVPPVIAFETSNTLSPTNPLGVKGCGEAGTIGALPAIMNAVIDALDGRQVEMPAAPEKVWRLCRDLDQPGSRDPS